MGKNSFTLVFEGDLRSFASNPLRTETPFGTPIAAVIGDALADTDALSDRLERAEEALHQIAEWSKAYPLEVFLEPDLEKARALLEAGGVTLDAVSASAMRHVVEGVGKIARDALDQGAPDGEG